MTNANGIKRYTMAELPSRRTESLTDLAAVRAKSEQELESDIAADLDFASVPSDWHAAAEAALPIPKKLLSLRLDTDVIDWFKQSGPGYQTRINAVLRAFVKHDGSAR